MNIQDFAISELHEYENNPRNNDGAVDVVAASIKEFGFKVPVIIDADGVIIAGHTRVKAARSLGMTSVPCIVADDLTPAQIRAFRLADNKTAEIAEWDFAKLDEELSWLDMDMGVFGFEKTFVEALELTEMAEANNGDQKLVHCPKCGFWFVP